MISVRIVYDTPGWAYFHRARILREYAPPDMKITIVPFTERFPFGVPDPNILFDMNYGHVEDVRSKLTQRRSKSILLTSFNNGWPRRREYFESACKHANAVLVNNREFWARAGALPGTYPLSNGVDRRVFACRTPIAARPRKVLWVGSEYHRGTKNYDALLTPLKQRLQSQGVATDFSLTDPYGRVRTHAEMAAWYNTGSVYIVASKTEGTPNPALEAASCGCVLVATRVGNMPELVRDRQNGIFVEPTVASIEGGVLEALQRRTALSEAMAPDIAAWDWATRAQDFYNLFRGLLSGEKPLLRAP